ERGWAFQLRRGWNAPVGNNRKKETEKKNFGPVGIAFSGDPPSLRKPWHPRRAALFRTESSHPTKAAGNFPRLIALGPMAGRRLLISRSSKRLRRICSAATRPGAGAIPLATGTPRVVSRFDQ